MVARMAQSTGTWVALLRGINVGGRRIVPMKELSRICADAGCEGVRTLIQSGNVVFRAPAARARSLPAAIEAALEERFGFAVPVVQRSLAELREIAAEHPLGAGAAESELHVGFLAARPTKARVAQLDPDRSPPDTFLVRGSQIYLRLPNGIARTKLTSAWLDSRLGTTVTVRNWGTTQKLLALAENV